MSVLFNHAIRHDLYDRNPIRWMRQSAKRLKAPRILSISEIQSLLSALDVRERTLVLLDVCTGLRMSELFALKWSDVNFETRELDVRCSVVKQIAGSCKTEASQKPVPLDRRLADVLMVWKSTTEYNKPEDWVFASPVHKGRRAILGSGHHAQCNPDSCARGWHRLAVRVALLSPHVFHFVTLQPSRREGDAGTAAPCIESGHARNLHAGDHGTEARGSEQCRQP
jgi:integrase